jgi:hypothetical protein
MAKAAFTCLILFFIIAIVSTSADAQNCVPFGGTIYAGHTTAWIGGGDFTVGRATRHANVVDVNTSISQDGDVWRGTETATFDFGKGNTVDLVTDFVTEHMNNATSTGIFHVNEIGTFSNGKGKFKNAYGHFSSQGPFGPNVKLPSTATVPEGSNMFWIGQYHGFICGVTEFK